MDDKEIKSKKIRKQRNFLRLALAIGALSFALFFFFIFLLLAKVISFNPPSYFVVFNLKEENITVNGTNLIIFDNYTGESNVPKDYLVKNSLNEEIFKKSIPELEFPKLTLFVNSETPYCFISADVTSFYYNNDLAENTIGHYQVLSEVGSKSIELKLDVDNYYYIFPGRYSQNSLPQNLVGKSLIGIYPIKCESINDSKTQIETVLFYKHFNSKDQQEYYNSKTEPLKEELSNI